MKKIIVKRFLSTDVETIGKMVLINNNAIIGELCTLELPWKDNKKKESCIPEGKYFATQYIRPSKEWSLWLQDVPNRTAILVHSANYTSQIQGCIAVGTEHTDINKDGIVDVKDSKVAMGLLKDFVGDQLSITIEVVGDYKIGDLDPKTEKRV